MYTLNSFFLSTVLVKLSNILWMNIWYFHYSKTLLSDFNIGDSGKGFLVQDSHRNIPPVGKTLRQPNFKFVEVMGFMSPYWMIPILNFLSTKLFTTWNIFLLPLPRPSYYMQLTFFWTHCWCLFVLPTATSFIMCEQGLSLSLLYLLLHTCKSCKGLHT